MAWPRRQCKLGYVAQSGTIRKKRVPAVAPTGLGGRRSTEQTRAVSQATPVFRVTIRDEATVAERGEQVVVWFVRYGAAWVRAADHPEAVVAESRADRQDEHCPPGTVWRRVVQLELPRGTAVRRTVSRPQSRSMSPMEHLLSGSLEKRREVEEVYYRVVGADRLERHDPK